MPSRTLVGEFGIDSAGFARVGLVKAAHTERALAAVAAEADWMKAEMGDGHISLLSRDEVRAELGSDGFVGGALTRGPGCIHPLNYVRGLAAGLSARGIRIHEDSPALAIRREPGRWWWRRRGAGCAPPRRSSPPTPIPT